MRITYRTLANLIQRMTPEQLDSDLTVEISEMGECFHAELRICGDNHDSLDPEHPVIYADPSNDERRDDADQIAIDIGLTPRPTAEI